MESLIVAQAFILFQFIYAYFALFVFVIRVSPIPSGVGALQVLQREVVAPQRLTIGLGFGIVRMASVVIQFLTQIQRRHFDLPTCNFGHVRLREGRLLDSFSLFSRLLYLLFFVVLNLGLPRAVVVRPLFILGHICFDDLRSELRFVLRFVHLNLVASVEHSGVPFEELNLRLLDVYCIPQLCVVIHLLESLGLRLPP